jgi:hypothetical protein
MTKVLARAAAGGAIVMVLASLHSCGFGSGTFIANYKQAVRSGFAKFPEAMQMESLFGEGDHFISSPGHGGIRKWYSEVFFGGRYTLTMEVDVKTDADFSRITEIVGSPLFVLTEASRVTTSGNRVTGADFSTDWKFRLDDWKKVVAAKGDFSVIGITITKAKPLQDFDAYVAAEREPRLKVRPE